MWMMHSRAGDHKALAIREHWSPNTSSGHKKIASHEARRFSVCSQVHINTHPVIVPSAHTHTERERERERDRKTQTQTDTKTHTQAHA